jgi:hypothetical protein
MPPNITLQQPGLAVLAAAAERERSSVRTFADAL